MNFVEIDLKLPDEFYELEEKMKELSGEQHFFIGGGSISNIYMGLPVRDVDIFYTKYLVKEEVEKVFGGYESLEAHTRADFDYGGGESTTWEEPYLYRIKYKGYEVELIHSPESRIYEFDLRFRQFFLVNGKVLATKEGLEDIKNKEIVISNPNNPVSTLFRIRRFEHELGFKVREISEKFLLWSFDNKGISADYAREYLEKNGHKTTPEILNSLYKWIDEHETENTTKRGHKNAIITNAPYPFHKETQAIVANYLENNYPGWVTIHYTLLEKYEPFKEKELEITIPFSKLERRINWLTSKLKSVRTKYIISPEQSITPYPIVKKENIEKEYKGYFKNGFLQKIACLFFDKDDGRTGNILYGTTAVPEKVQVKICQKSHHDMLGDYLTHNTLTLRIGDHFSYVIRKCTNGKYTIADIDHTFANGAAFYLQAVGDSLKEAIPEFFDFRNEHLEGIYEGNYHGVYLEYFFGQDYLKRNLYEVGSKTFTVPISKTHLKETMTA